MTSPKKGQASVGAGGSSFNREMFADVNRFLDGALAELDRLRAQLNADEARHEIVIEDMRVDIDKEVTLGRESASQFRQEFDSLVHERCQTVAEGLQAMENNQKFAHGMQEKALISLENDVKGLRQSLCAVNGSWSRFKSRNTARAPLCQKRTTTTMKTRRESTMQEFKRLEVQKTAKALYETVESLRARLKVAAEGLHGRSWGRLFEDIKGSDSSSVSFESFCQVVREKLKVRESEDKLRVVFDSLDEDASGSISIEELVEFVADPAVRMRCRIRSAATTRCPEAGLSELVRACDKDNSGQISFSEFKLLCRSQLKILDSDMHLHHVFNAVDRDHSGLLSVDEFLMWMEEDADGGK